MKDTSWIKLFRKIEDWEWFPDSKTFHVFIFLLIKANIKSSKWNGKTIRRGQTVTSYRKIADATGMSVSSVKRAINNLVSTEEIIIEPTNRYSLITIVKYETYQAQYSDFEPADELTEEHRTEPSAEYSGEPHNKKVKNNNDKNNKNAGSGITSRKAKPDNNKKRIHTKPATSNITDDEYVPRYFEFDLKIPKSYYGKFKNADEWWEYAEHHREEVEKAYEL